MLKIRYFLPMPPRSPVRTGNTSKAQSSPSFRELMLEAMDQSADPVFIVNKQGKLVYGNKEFKKIKSSSQGLNKKEVRRWNVAKPTRSIHSVSSKHGKLLYINETITPVKIKGAVNYFLVIWKDVTAEHRSHSKVQRQAFYDFLTSLPNRALLLERIDAALKIAKREKHHVAIMFIDLDKFKPINDTYGHATGDIVLKLVAKRLLASVRETDTVARLGGDEFVVLMNLVKSVDDIHPVAQIILKQLKKPFKVGNNSFNVTASIGVSLFPNHAKRGHELLHIADLAMKQAEKRGGGDYQLFNS